MAGGCAPVDLMLVRAIAVLEPIAFSLGLLAILAAIEPADAPAVMAEFDAFEF